MTKALSALAVSAVALSTASAAPAMADELEDALVAINASFIGPWVGTIDSGGVTEEDAFTLAVTSEDGLDYAFWRDESLSWSKHQGEGAYRLRIWTADGGSNALDLQVGEIEGPDDDGNWKMVESFTAAATNGVEMDWRNSYDYRDGVIHLTVASRPAGSGDAFATSAVMTYRRPE